MLGIDLIKRQLHSASVLRHRPESLMDKTSIQLASGHLDKVLDVGHDDAGPRHVDCAVDHVGQPNESKTCSAQEHPRRDDQGEALKPSLQNRPGGILLRMLGSEQNVGLLFMALSSVGVAMMGLFVKLGGKAGLSTWQIILSRSLVVSAVCLLQLARRGVKPWGNR